MSKLPSSKQIIKTLTDKGFIFVSQRGSHAKFKKDNRIVMFLRPKKKFHWERPGPLSDNLV